MKTGDRKAPEEKKTIGLARLIAIGKGAVRKIVP
jgi:hypothetical protein